MTKLTDRELDALVAKEVMNLSPCLCEKTPEGHSVFKYDPQTGRCNFCGNGPIAFYSTQISAAWEVVRKMRIQLFSKRRAFTVELQLAISERLGINGYVHSSEIILHVKPRDICEAALRLIDTPNASSQNS